MSCPLCVDKMFINLKVLSKIKAGQKVYTDDGYLILDVGVSYRQTIARWWTNENRIKTLEKIQEVVKSSIYCGNTIISQKNLIDQLKKLEIYDKIEKNGINDTLNIHTMNSLIDGMQNANKGIKNLKETYSGDTHTCSKLELEIEKMENARKKFIDFLGINGKLENSADYSKKVKK